RRGQTPAEAGSGWEAARGSSRHRAKASGMHGAEGMLIIIDKLRDRRRGNIEHWLRIDAKNDGENNERRHDGDFAPADIPDVKERRLFQRAKDDLAIKPERVGRRENGAERRQRRDPVVDSESADQA